MTKYNKIIIYTDGSCLNNPGPGGWAVLFLDQNLQTLALLCMPSTETTTNNIMELTAAIKALEKCQPGAEFHADETMLYTDSSYLKDGITKWILNWKKNNWTTADKKPVKNQSLWHQLDQLTQTINVTWNWVKAHDVNPFNSKVDDSARKMAQQARQMFEKQ